MNSGASNLTLSEWTSVEMGDGGWQSDYQKAMNTTKIQHHICELIDYALFFKDSKINITKTGDYLEIRWNEKEINGGWSADDIDRFFNTIKSTNKNNIKGTSNDKKGCRISIANLLDNEFNAEIYFFNKHTNKYEVRIFNNKFQFKIGDLNEYTNNKNNAVMYKKRDSIGLLKCNKNFMVENVD